MNEEHSDLSLACEDGQQFDVHKLVLSACSPFFQVAAKIRCHDSSRNVPRNVFTLFYIQS